MTLLSAVETYVRLKQSLGAVFSRGRPHPGRVRPCGGRRLREHDHPGDVHRVLPRPRSADAILVTQTRGTPWPLSVSRRARSREPFTPARTRSTDSVDLPAVHLHPRRRGPVARGGRAAGPSRDTHSAADAASRRSGPLHHRTPRRRSASLALLRPRRPASPPQHLG